MAFGELAPRLMARLFVQFCVNNVGAFRVRGCRIAGVGFAAGIGGRAVILIGTLGSSALGTALAAFARRQNLIQDVLHLFVVEQAQGASLLPPPSRVSTLPIASAMLSSETPHSRSVLSVRPLDIGPWDKGIARLTARGFADFNIV